MLNDRAFFYFTFFSRWRIVVHGGVDGYSRIPVYIHTSNNNRADTVLQLFLGAVDEYGLPLRVRSDKGGENVDVSWYMLTHEQRGPARGSMITGIELQICISISLPHAGRHFWVATFLEQG
jgi:hypothetical protein